MTYKQLDNYIASGTSGDEKLDRRIEKMHDANLHKLRPMPSYNPARLWAMPTEV